MTTPSIPAPEPSSHANQSSAPKHGRWVIGALILLLAIHAIQATRLFPSVDAIFDPETPVLIVDHAIHEYHGALGAQFLKESGRSWGYDPFFMAGYPETPVWDSSSNASILFNLLGSGQGFRGYKVGLWICSLLLITATAISTRLIGLSWVEATIATFFAWFVFWAGFAISLWRTGLFSFVTVAACCCLLLALCVRFHYKPGRVTCVVLAITGASLFFLHVTAPILVIGGALAFYLFVARRHGKNWHAGIGLAVLFTIVVNLIWLVPLWNFRSLRTGDGAFLVDNNLAFIINFFIAQTRESRVALILLVLGSVGLVRWWKTDRQAATMAFGGSIVSMILLTSFGSFWPPTRLLEPMRFRVVFLFLLSVPAATGMVFLSRLMTQRVRLNYMRAILAPGIWLALASVWVMLEPQVIEGYVVLLTMDRPLVVGYRPEMTNLVDWIKTNTDLSARIMFEDQLRLLETTDPESTHWSPMLPKMLEPETRLFIGGLYEGAFIKHKTLTNFGDFELGPITIDFWPPLDLKRYFDTYNVGWVICWSPLSRFWFDNLSMAEKVATFPRFVTPNKPPVRSEHALKALTARAGQDLAKQYIMEGERSYSIYRINRPHNYFIRGKGRLVSATPDRLEFADIEPELGSVTLGMHWQDGFQSDPNLLMQPMRIAPDPVDFIRFDIPGPLPRLVITNGKNVRSR